ncbi:hypothetical protein ACQ27_gp519 [Klebsiella phage K64-1]|uniref:hypothetical protein n=1 Tax=Klebsiella phage K64-1 TaxID=1439894 RepID=UPI00248B1ED8|nr:hypothetical protein ACQ27_gp519 [Klebsiella phage K64-1]
MTPVAEVLSTKCICTNKFQYTKGNNVVRYFFFYYFIIRFYEYFFLCVFFIKIILY